MKYAVIGGAGAMGSITVRDLVETANSKDEIVIADYNIEKAESMVKAFNKKNVKAIKIDLRDLESTSKTLKGCDVLINTSQHDFNLTVMEIALKISANYVDLGGLFHITRKQLELNDSFKKAGKTAVLGSGAAPGITNVLARYAVDEMTSVNEIHIRLGSVDKTKYSPKPALAISYSLKTILEEFSFEPAVFKKGRFKFVEPMSGADPHRFPSPVGIQKPMYTLHSEVATLPITFKKKGVKEVSFKIAFNQEFLDKVKFLRDLGLASHDLMDLNGVKIAPVDLVNKVAMNQPTSKRVGELKQYEVLRSVVKGIRRGKKVTWIVDCHTSGMQAWDLGTDINTGCPPSIVAQMIAYGKIKEKGVLAPEKAIDPNYFFEELAKRQMFIKVQKKDGWTFEV